MVYDGNPMPFNIVGNVIIAKKVWQDYMYLEQIIREIIIPPAKPSFSGGYCFQHVRDSVIPSTFKVFTL